MRRKPHKKGDLSDTGNIVADSSGLGGHLGGIGDGMGLEDSFQRIYSKELDLDEGKDSRFNVLSQMRYP